MKIHPKFRAIRRKRLYARIYSYTLWLLMLVAGLMWARYVAPADTGMKSEKNRIYNIKSNDINSLQETVPKNVR